jgi:hypothetical protein
MSEPAANTYEASACQLALFSLRFVTIWRSHETGIALAISRSLTSFLFLDLRQRRSDVAAPNTYRGSAVVV